MRSGITKLDRRIEELKGVNVGAICDLGDPNMAALQRKIDTTLVDVLGVDSIDYQRHCIPNLHAGGIWLEMTTQDI
jgi:hypothetical protein